jgi:hypothetical protein
VKTFKAALTGRFFHGMNLLLTSIFLNNTPQQPLAQASSYQGDSKFRKIDVDDPVFSVYHIFIRSIYTQRLMV